MYSEDLAPIYESLVRAYLAAEPGTEDSERIEQTILLVKSLMAAEKQKSELTITINSKTLTKTQELDNLINVLFTKAGFSMREAHSLNPVFKEFMRQFAIMFSKYDTVDKIFEEYGL